MKCDECQCVIVPALNPAIQIKVGTEKDPAVGRFCTPGCSIAFRQEEFKLCRNRVTLQAYPPRLYGHAQRWVESKSGVPYPRVLREWWVRHQTELHDADKDFDNDDAAGDRSDAAVGGGEFKYKAGGGGAVDCY